MPGPNTLTSAIFRLTPSLYMGAVASRLAGKVWWLGALPAAAAAVAAVFDPRMLYVALMLVFVVYPIVVSLAWFNYALKPRAVAAIAPSRIAVSPAGITVERLRMPYGDDDGDHAPPVVVSRLTVPWTSVLAVEHTRRMMLFVTSRAADGFIAADIGAVTPAMAGAADSYLYSSGALK